MSFIQFAKTRSPCTSVNRHLLQRGSRFHRPGQRSQYQPALAERLVFCRQRYNLRCSASSIAELIPYVPVKKSQVYDLRLYNAYPVAETCYVRRDEGFLLLGEYMSGANSTQSRMKETQPIVMCYYPEGQKKMRVRISPKDVLADPESQEQPPQPKSSDVSVEIAGGELVAAIRFEGVATPEVASAQRQRLVAALEADGIQLATAEAEGFFRVAQYGPLNSLSVRLNEIWLAVSIG